MPQITPKHARALAKLLATKSLAELRAIHKKVKKELQGTKRGGFELDDLPATPMVVAGLICVLFAALVANRISEDNAEVTEKKYQSKSNKINQEYHMGMLKHEVGSESNCIEQMFETQIESAMHAGYASVAWCYYMQTKIWKHRSALNYKASMYLFVYQISLIQSWGYLGLWARSMSLKIFNEKLFEKYTLDVQNDRKFYDEKMREIGAMLQKNTGYIGEILKYAQDQCTWDTASYSEAIKVNFWHNICKELVSDFKTSVRTAEKAFHTLNNTEPDTEKANSVFGKDHERFSILINAYVRLRNLTGKSLKFECGMFYDAKSRTPVESGNLSHKLFSPSIGYIDDMDTLTIRGTNAAATVPDIMGSLDGEIMNLINRNRVYAPSQSIYGGWNWEASHKFEHIKVETLTDEVATNAHYLLEEGGTLTFEYNNTKTEHTKNFDEKSKKRWISQKGFS